LRRLLSAELLVLVLLVLVLVLLLLLLLLLLLGWLRGLGCLLPLSGGRLGAGLLLLVVGALLVCVGLVPLPVGFLLGCEAWWRLVPAAAWHPSSAASACAWHEAGAAPSSCRAAGVACAALLRVGGGPCRGMRRLRSALEPPSVLALLELEYLFELLESWGARGAWEAPAVVGVYSSVAASPAWCFGVGVVWPLRHPRC
jgi:hypothetical protein